jgi:FkbM family methyltransferase
MLNRRQIQTLRDEFRLNILGRNTIRRSVGDCTANFRRDTPAEKRHFEINFHLEKPLLGQLLSTVNEDDVVWDVGANVGLYSCFVGQIADVVAFEPQPANYNRLNENLEANRVSAETFECALGDSDETVEFDMDSRGQIAGAGRGAVAAGDGGHSVDQKEGGSLVTEGVAPPSVVKIDVEGAEEAVIDGIENLLRSPDCRLVLSEVHLARAIEIEDVEAKLSELDFDVSEFERSENEATLVGVKS